MARKSKKSRKKTGKKARKSTRRKGKTCKVRVSKKSLSVTCPR